MPLVDHEQVGKVLGRCPLCAEDIDEYGLRCTSCDAVHHLGCGVELGGCGRYGCPEMATRDGRIYQYLEELLVDHRLSLHMDTLLFGWGARWQLTYGHCGAALVLGVAGLLSSIQHWCVRRAYVRLTALNVRSASTLGAWRAWGRWHIGISCRFWRFQSVWQQIPLICGAALVLMPAFRESGSTTLYAILASFWMIHRLVPFCGAESLSKSRSRVWSWEAELRPFFFPEQEAAEAQTNMKSDELWRRDEELCRPSSANR
jgi:hypothetical protein